LPARQAAFGAMLAQFGADGGEECLDLGRILLRANRGFRCFGLRFRRRHRLKPVCIIIHAL